MHDPMPSSAVLETEHALQRESDEGARPESRLAALQSQSRPAGLATLTTRETEVLMHAIGGRSSKAIAHELRIADSTVRVLLWRAARRLGARTRRELLETALVLSRDHEA
jgi:DNA-binding NarL/FixJ family response regulator